MKFKPIPFKTYNEPLNHKELVHWVDDLLLWKDEDSYNRRWEKRCGECLAPCCFLSMAGRYYDYTNEDNKDPKMHEFFKNDFVIINLKDKSFKEHAEEDGFNIQLDAPELKKLQVCPLNIMGKCSIYEDRPKICRNWKCIMKEDKHLGVK